MKTKTAFIFIIVFLAGLISLACIVQDRLKVDKSDLKQRSVLIENKSDSLITKPLFIKDTGKADVVADVSEKLTEELADVDTAGLNAKTDSIKQALIDLGATVSEDSVYVIGSDGAVLVHIDNLKKPSGKKFLDWAPYLISVLGVLLIIFFSSIKSIQKIPIIANSQNVIVQRFFAKTNKFWKQVQKLTITLAGIGGSVLMFNAQVGGLIPADWISSIQTLTIVCLAVAGGATLTSAKHGNTPATNPN